MSNFLTEGRLALSAALQGDPEIDARVKTYFDFGPGLTRRRALEPAFCPALSVAPAEATCERASNLQRLIPQRLRVEVATDGQDVAPCEELVALVVDRIAQCNLDLMGLGEQGLERIHVTDVRWSTLPGQAGARLLWTAAVDVVLLWRRNA